jgi:uncharacterized protein (TIGR03067 family)
MEDRMRKLALLILTAGLLIAADTKDDDSAKKEVKQLAGTYTMVSGESKNEKLSEERIKEAALTMEADKYTAKFGNDTVTGTFKLNPTKTPKEIDATGPDGNTMLGIYKFEKGQLTVCFAPSGQERPKEFTIKTGTGDFIHVWKKKGKD